MAEHKHGEMDVSDHEKTFDGFIRMSVRTTVVIIAILILLALLNINT